MGMWLVIDERRKELKIELYRFARSLGMDEEYATEYSELYLNNAYEREIHKNE